MKKTLVILLGALFLMSFAASAFAIHSEIPSDTQAAVAKGSTQLTLGGEIRARGWWSDNISSAKMPTEANQGAWYDQRIRLNIDAAVNSNVSGMVQLESGVDKDSTLKGGYTSDLYTWGNFNSKTSGLNILQAWILYKGSGLFGFPAGLKVGHMPLALGEKQFFDHTKFGDDAIVFFMDPTKQVHVGLLTIKLGEGSTTKSGDDLDAYVGLVTFKPMDTVTVGANVTRLNMSDGRFKPWNLGVHANGTVGPAGFRAEMDLQTGKWDANTKAKGFAFFGEGSFKVDPVKVRGAFAYGTGNKAAGDGKHFQTYLGADQHYTLVYEYRVNSTAGATATGLNNTTYFNVGVDAAPMPDLKVSGDAYLIRATKNVAGGSKTAGWEVDGKVAYQVAKNLSYQVDAGFFKAGNFYANKKNATVLRQTLTLSF